MEWMQFYWNWLRLGFTGAWAIAGGRAGGLAIIGGFIAWKFPKVGGTMNQLIWQIPLLLFVVLAFIGLIIAPYTLYKEQKAENAKLQVELDKAERQGFATPDALLASTYNGLSIRISDLTREGDIVRGKVFDDCDIYGPALIFPSGCVIEHCIFDSSVDSTFVVTTNTLVSGAIVFENCIIKNSRLYRVGFIGSSSVISNLKKGFK